MRDANQRRLAGLKSSDVAGAARVAVLPLGAIEQHGPHLPLGTDLIIAEALSARAVDQASPDSGAVLLPAIPFGKSDEHDDFAGTVSLRAQTMVAILEDIGASIARSDIRRLLIISGHGGNSEVMGIAARNLRRQSRMAVVATNFMRFGLPDRAVAEDEVRYGIHGGLIETSLMLHLAPEKVDMAKAKDFASAAQAMANKGGLLGFSGAGAMSWLAQDLNPDGVVGNAAAATAEIGQTIADHQSAHLAKLIDELAVFDLSSLK